MIKKYGFIFILMIFSTNSFAQQTADSIPKITLGDIAEINQGSSYITFPSYVGNGLPLWFEGNLTPNFFIRKSKDAKFLSVITSQIIIRMYRKKSFPVRTPSYMPQITGYYFLSSKSNVNSLSIFSRIAHHSNGQDGDFYLPNGEINLKSGNFVTNYFDFGITKTSYSKKYNAVKFFQTSIEIHPKLLMNDELQDLYSVCRWNTLFSIFKIPNDDKSIEKKANISLKGQTSLMLGNYNNVNAFSTDRLNVTFTFYYHPAFFEDIGFFVQFYHGMDYYNIYFNQQITNLQFGIMTEKLRF